MTRSPDYPVGFTTDGPTRELLSEETLLGEQFPWEEMPLVGEIGGELVEFAMYIAQKAFGPCKLRLTTSYDVRIELQKPYPSSVYKTRQLRATIAERDLHELVGAKENVNSIRAAVQGPAASMPNLGITATAFPFYDRIGLIMPEAERAFWRLASSISTHWHVLRDPTFLRSIRIDLRPREIYSVKSGDAQAAWRDGLTIEPKSLVTWRDVCEMSSNRYFTIGDPVWHEMHVSTAAPVLHRDMGPALVTADGTEYYALWGRRVPAVIAMTPAKELDFDVFSTISNAEHSRVFIRKSGVGFLEEISQVVAKETITVDEPVYAIDQETGLGIIAGTNPRTHYYELLHIDISEGIYGARLLKMTNPSTGDTHLEPVPEWITTVQQALAFRNDGLRRWHAQPVNAVPPVQFRTPRWLA